MTRILRVMALALAALIALTGVAAAALQPIALRVAGDSGWHAENDFQLRWDRLAGDPPARASFVRVRDAYGSVVVAPVRIPGDGLIEHVYTPGLGRFSADVWLEDSAGNLGPMVSTTLAFDDVRPGAARLQAPAGWIAGSKAATVAVEPTAPWPLSGIGGYAFSVDRGGGSSPCAGPSRCQPTEIDVPATATAFSLGVLPEGANVVRAFAVSGAGMRSSELAAAIVRVDASVPKVSLSAPREWVDGPQRIEAAASDEQSGMAAAGPSGPYTAIAVDGGVPRLDPGAATSAVVSGEGVHRIAAYGRDAAGNAGDESPLLAAIRIDETPPQVAFSNAQDPADPERIEATVSDRLAGPDPSRGSIAVRPAGSHQRFQPLPTTVADGRLVARWDSDAFAPGVYEFRASGYDAAGNAGSSDRRAGGARMALANPVKTPTRVLAGFGGRRLTWQRCRRRQGQRRCHRQEIESFEARPDKRAVPYGRGIPYSGRLTTAAGAELGDLPVAIVESFGAAGRPAQRTTVVHTAADGSFAARLAPGPSRRVETVFAGTRTLTRSGGGSVELAVQAGVRLRPSATVARIGGAPIVFRGHLADPGAVPSGGVPVELQFRLPGREWAQFRTVQSDGRGRFLYAYTFSDDDSRGVRFQFRAFVPAAVGWPYEPAASRPAFVTGR